MTTQSAGEEEGWGHIGQEEALRNHKNVLQRTVVDDLSYDLNSPYLLTYIT